MSVCRRAAIALLLATIGCPLLASAAPRFRGPANVLPLPASSANYAAHLDVDGDGLEDIVSGSSSGVHLFRMVSDAEYTAPLTLLAGTSVLVLGAGRANADDDPDVVVYQRGAARMGALLNTGGSLAPSPTFGAAPFMLSLAVADFDGDEVLDVVGTHTDSTAAYLFLNDGAGGFGSPTALPLPFRSVDLVQAADLDADGDADLAISGGQDSLAVFLGHGDGTFDAALIEFSPVNYPRVFAHLDGTAGLDGIFSSGSALYLRSGTGDGGFGLPSMFDSGIVSTPFAASGDLDGDGDADLANTLNTGQEVVRITLGHGDGTFDPGVDYPAGVLPSDVELADLDGDGRLDVMVSAILSAMVAILPGNGDGTFGGPRALTTPNVRDVELADLDGDGDLDAVSVDDVTGALTRWRGEGDGRFTTPVAAATGGLPVSVETGHLDADAFLDVLVPIAGQLRIFRNDGAGGLLPPTTVTITGSPRQLATGDLNGDGKLDVVLASNSNGTANVLLGDGAGGMTAAPSVVAASGSVTRAAIGRFGGDAIPDLALANEGQVLVYTGLGNGTFPGAPQVLTLPTLPAIWTAGTLEAVDADGDADLDLFAVITAGETRVVFWRNNGAGVFAPRVDLDTRAYPAVGVFVPPADLRVRDFDGDGAVDIFVVPAHASRATGLFAGTSPGTFAPIRILGGAYTGSAVDAGDVDGDGDLDLVVASRGSTTFNSPGALATMLNQQELVAVPTPGPGGANPGIAFAAAWPSPARGPFSIRYRLLVAAPARVDVVSIDGRRVITIDDAPSTAGEHTLRLGDRRALAAGVYAVVVTQAGRQATRKVVVLP